MITVTEYNHKLEVIAKHEFETPEDVSKYYRNRKSPDDPEPIPDGCWNCMNFNWMHEACTVNWNNMDESYYCPDTDDRELTDYCEYHETDPEADPECLELGGNEP